MKQRETLHTTPLTRSIGSEIHDVELSNVTGTTIDAIQHAFLERKVLVFRDQSLTPEQQLAFGAHFGEFQIHPFRESIPGHPELLVIAKEPNERQNVGGGWHTDMTFMPEPPKGSMLYAIEVPEGLGDTMFSDNEAAFAALSDGMRRMLSGLEAVHSAERVHGIQATREQGSFRQASAHKPEATQEVVHPVVRAHPETGREGLFVNAAFTRRFVDMTEAESRPLLEFLFAQMVRPEFVLRARWHAGTFVLWDNRCTQHFALNDYHGQRREMRRLMVRGERPLARADGVTARSSASG